MQKSIKDSVHKLLSDQIERLGLGYFYEIIANEVRGKNGTEFLFAGLSDLTVESIKSFEGCDICWIEEARSITKRSLTILEPTIRKDDSELWLSFNPELDTDEVYDRFVVHTPLDCLLININWDDNPWRSKVLDVARETMQREKPDEYAHVYGGMCKPAVDGAIYYNEMAAMLKEPARIRNVPYDPMLKVHMVFDIGRSDKTAIIFVQRLASEIRIIRYMEDTLKDWPYYVGEIKKLNYNLGKCWFPHDGHAKRMESLGQSSADIVHKLGLVVAPKTLVPSLSVEEGIKSARLIFPRIYMDKANCKDLIDNLKRYKRNIPATTGEAGAPVHDAASHGSDAFRIMALIVDKMINEDEDTVLTYEQVPA